MRQQLCSPQNVNCRDLEGRHSTPLHFAAGYNRVAVVEFLLHHGADVHAKDKGSVLPPIAASLFSVGHQRLVDNIHSEIDDLKVHTVTGSFLNATWEM